MIQRFVRRSLCLAVLSLSFAVLFAALAPPAAPASAANLQGVWFEMLKDLEGFEGCYLGEHSSLYDFAPFEERSKHMISRRELEELRELWARERARVAAEIERLDTDPAARSLYKAKHKIEKNAYFSGVDKEWIDTHAPFYFVVERPKKDRDNYYAQKAGDYAKWQQALHELFLAEYVQPLGLKLRPDYQVFVTAVLPTSGAYSDYAQRNQAGMMQGQRAHYDSNLRAAVTFEPWTGGQVDADERRHAVMHELVHGFQHAYGGRDKVPAHPWLNEGFAEYLSSGTSGAVESLREHPLDEGARKEIAQLLKRSGARDAYVLPLEDLLEAKSYYDVARRVYRRCRRVGFQQGVALSAFYRQSYLLVYWLSREANAETRAAFQDYLKGYFRGSGDREAFEQAFAQVDLEELESSYLTWIEPKAKGWRPPRIKAPVAATEAGASEAQALPEYDADALRACAEEPETALAIAVYDVLDGRPEAARARLEAVAQQLGPEDARRQRLSRELERVRAWVKLRNRYLGWLVAEGGKLWIEQGGRRSSTKVEEIRDGVLLLGDNKLGPRKRRLESLAMHELDPLDLADEMAKARDFDATWARFYVAVAGGRDNWDAKLSAWEKKQPEGDRTAETLRADEEEFAALRREGELAARLVALSEAPLPETAAAAQALLDEIEAVHALRASSASVARAMPALRGLTAVCATQAAEDRALDDLLAGEVTDLGDGRVRIRYPLQSAAELRDFESFEHLPPFVSTSTGRPRAKFRVAGGKLTANGRGGLRHIARFEGQQALRYHLRFPQEAPISFGAVICANEGRSLIYCSGIGDLLVSDEHDPEMRQVGSGDTIILEKEYELELTHDGSDWVTLKRKGAEPVQIGCGSCKAGAMLFKLDMDARVELREIELEGKLTDDSLERMRAAWVRARVAALDD